MAKNLKAYLRYTGDGRIVPGGNISSRQAPKVGRWEEINRDVCCTTTTTSTTSTTSTTTTSTTSTTTSSTTTTTTTLAP